MLIQKRRIYMNQILFPNTTTDYCQETPGTTCYNGGTCNPVFGGYTCTCTSSYKGEYCETGKVAHSENELPFPLLKYMPYVCMYNTGLSQMKTKCGPNQ